jgi:hypothetical protein
MFPLFGAFKNRSSGVTADRTDRSYAPASRYRSTTAARNVSAITDWGWAPVQAQIAAAMGPNQSL